jgi:hypothetical protein
MKTALKVVSGLIGLIVVVSLLGLVLGWFKAGTDIVGPGNVKEQYQVIIDDWNALYVAAENACTVGAPEKEQGDPVFVEDPAMAYAATYRRIAAQYNSHMQDIFRAKLVAPEGYPDKIDIAETRGVNPDWCLVSQRLDELRPG